MSEPVTVWEARASGQPIRTTVSHVGEEGRARRLVRVPPAEGTLVRINTRHEYTRGACVGSIAHVAGDARCIAAGLWAEGTAGGLGGGADGVWAVQGRAVLLVRYSGGRGKGGGWRVVVVDGDSVVVADGGESDGSALSFLRGQDPREVLTAAQRDEVVAALDAAGLVPALVSRWRAMR